MTLCKRLRAANISAAFQTATLSSMNDNSQQVSVHSSNLLTNDAMTPSNEVG